MMGTIPPSSHRLHILHVIDTLDVGGMERMLVDLANQAVHDGHAVSVCATRRAGKIADDLEPAIPQLVLERNGRFDVSAMRRLWAFVRSNDVDIVHAHGRSTFSMLAFLRQFNALRLPIILHDHFGVEIDDSVPWWFPFAARRHAAHYVGTYEGLRTWAIKAGVPSDRVSVVGNALSLQRLTATGAHGGPLGARPTILAIGGLRREKGTDVLLRAVARSTNLGAFDVWIVGGDRDSSFADHCRRLSIELGLENVVSFLGERNDIPALLRCAHIGVIASRSESGPLVLIEFMAVGLPFVATRVGDIARRAEAEGLGEFVDPDDVGALSQALDRTMELDSSELRRRVSKGIETVRKCFDIRIVAYRWYDLYRSVIETG